MTEQYEDAIEMHKRWQGKIEVISRVSVKSAADLSVAYTPGVAKPCLEIEKDADLSYSYTRRSNMIAVITDGSAVLGLGNIGALAGMPVMEGKCVLFKEFGGVDAFPVCIKSQDTEEIINVIKNISGSFGGINLEDISAPRCFEIERRLIGELDIPVFHDDQHGTAVVTLAALTNALKLTGKRMDGVRTVIQGAGAAGVAICKLLLKRGMQDIILCDRKGIIYQGRDGLDASKTEISLITNKERLKGSVGDALEGADIFIGVSGPNTVDADMIKSMSDKPVVFAMSNPDPEIPPAEALAAGAYILGTGRSDYPNQINNVLAFPGIFRGALDVRASVISDSMKIKAAEAIASLVSDGELTPEYIIPKPFNPEVGSTVAKAVAKQAISEGVNRI
jgi:malate dehydrogenase (oxaloacetate-decarboxylating)